ncbi:MAG: CHAD domain-containing protein [Burkholderiales bacterium]
MAQEIELKLSVPPQDAPRIWRSRTLSSLPRSKPVSRRLFSAYYDTPARDLARRGVALRLRRENGRWMQTVKGSGTAVSGLHARSEFETEVPAQFISFPALTEAGLAELVEDAAFRQSLEVVFTTDFMRATSIAEPASGDRIEISLDRGDIVAGGRHEALCEIELELKSGSATRLFDLAAELAGELPLRLDNVSKAERGYRLAGAASLRPVKAAASALLEDMNVDAAFQAVVSACLQHLQANERGVLESNDPEYIHQARVAIRRLRCALGLFGHAVPKPHFAGSLTWLKSLAATLGAARDRDVFCSGLLAEALSGGVGSLHTSARTIRQRAAAQRGLARKRAKAALADPGYTQRSLAFSRLLAEGAWAQTRDAAHSGMAALPLTEFAAKLLLHRDRKVRKRGSELKRDEPATLHALRIQIKKLRYACEFFAPLFGRKAVKRYLSRLEALQDILGELNDAATADRLLDELASRTGDPGYQQTVGFLRGYAAASADARLDELGEAWERFERTESFW